MPAYIFLMHDDSVADEQPWEPYLDKLRQRGVFDGGSAIGEGLCLRKAGAAPGVTAHLAGFIRVNADLRAHLPRDPAGRPHPGALGRLARPARRPPLPAAGRRAGATGGTG